MLEQLSSAISWGVLPLLRHMIYAWFPSTIYSYAGNKCVNNNLHTSWSAHFSARKYKCSCISCKILCFPNIRSSLDANIYKNSGFTYDFMLKKSKGSCYYANPLFPTPLLKSKFPLCPFYWLQSGLQSHRGKISDSLWLYKISNYDSNLYKISNSLT